MTSRRRESRKTRSSRNKLFPKLSSQTYQILTSSWNQLCKHVVDSSESYLSVKKTSLTKSDISTLQKTNMYSYIPEKIRHEFESSHQFGVKCETTLKRGRKVVIYLAIPKDEDFNIDVSLKNMIAWLNFVSEVASSKCSQTLNIYLLLTNAKKRSPEVDTEPIDTIHANTAFTTYCLPLNDIYVFRREEWFKVFMHETFHCFGLDFSSSVGDDSNRRIISLFKAVDPNTDIRLYETFCELWAEVFYLMFCLFMDTRGKCSHFSSSKYFAALQKERRFSIYQSNKILKRAGYNYKTIFIQPLVNKPKYREKTQAFSYYVIKSLMMWNLDRFVKWCDEYCGRGESDKYSGREAVGIQSNSREQSSPEFETPPIQFILKNIPEYCNLVEELVETDGGYRHMTVQIITPPKIKLRGIDLSHTLRMTSIDHR